MSTVIPLRSNTPTHTTLPAAIDSFLASVDLADSTIDVYAATLQALVDDLESDIPLSKIGRATIGRHLKERYGSCAPATYNRNLATISSLLAWCEENE